MYIFKCVLHIAQYCTDSFFDNGIKTVTMDLLNLDN